ncbi:MAG TPA: hypothetical protein VGD31_17080, partial [Sphingobacteriaceae bacterium]
MLSSGASRTTCLKGLEIPFYLQVDIGLRRMPNSRFLEGNYSPYKGDSVKTTATKYRPQVNNHHTAILLSNFITISNNPPHSLNLYCMKPA